MNIPSSIEFVIPEGFLFIPANLAFISFCFFISFIIFKMYKSFFVFFISLFSFLSIMYYDLFFNAIFKIYLETTSMNSTIYAYPRKDANNKIESLSTIRVYNYELKYGSSLSDIEKEKLTSLHESYINNFIDITTYRYKYNTFHFKNERLYLNIYKYNSEFLDESMKKARFSITVSKSSSTLTQSYKQYDYKFVDTLTNEVLAEAFLIKFEPSYDKLRNRLLYWSKPKEDEFVLDSVQNFDYIYKKLFIDEV